MPVRVNLSGSEEVDRTEDYYKGEGCGGTHTWVSQAKQTLRWDAKSRYASIYNNKAVLAASIPAEVVGTREVVQNHEQFAHGSCSDTPGVVESGPGTDYDGYFDTRGCGTERYKTTLDVANLRNDHRFIYADGWHTDHAAGAFSNCANDLYEFRRLKPRPAAGPNGTNSKLEALRAGRRDKVTFSFEHTYEIREGYDRPSEFPNSGESWEATTFVTIRWEAKVTRPDR
jgi:hypothetical protein